MSSPSRVNSFVTDLSGDNCEVSRSTRIIQDIHNKRCNINSTKALERTQFKGSFSQSLDMNFSTTDSRTVRNIEASCCNADSMVIEQAFNFKKKGVCIAFLNIHHLLPKLEEIKYYLRQPIKPHIFGFCETFLHNSIDDQHISIANYRFERKDRANKQGGGILIYISEDIPYTRRHDIECTDIESIWIQITLRNKQNFLLNFTYRPPCSNQAWIDLYDSQVEYADQLNIEFHLLGDYNIQFLLDNPTRKYLNSKWGELVTKFGLNQLVEFPTRVSKQSSTIIDHIYTNKIENVAETIVPPVSISDHYPICFTRSSGANNCENKSTEHKTITYRSFKNFNESHFQQDLACSNISYTETISEPNLALKTFCDILNNILSMHAPLKVKRIKRDHQPEWFTDEIRSLIYKRDICHKNRNIQEYKSLRNKISSIIKKNKKEIFNKAISESQNPKHIWKHLKDITSSNQGSDLILPQCVMVDDTEVNDKLDILNELNRHFVNISNIITKTKFANENFHALKEKLNSDLGYNIFEVTYITPLDVKHIIDNLNVKKSTGIDGISPRILKMCGDFISTGIASIINNSISSSTFPDMMKTARVIPIYKNGDKDDLGNYRPISILPTISKIFERHIANQVQSYFKKTNILHKTQSGFRKNHSCNTALVRLIDTWLKDVDEGKLVGTVFLDLRKAFDLVDHQILLYKLRLHHFSERTLQLFRSYLSNRRQMVTVGNLQSELLSVTSGVPQGSILGPLLFLIYINDLPLQCHDMNIDLYADDSTLHQSDFHLGTIQSKLQQNLNYIFNWCKLNNMAINPTKTTCMLIGTPYKLKHTGNLCLTIDSQNLNNVNNQKILGIYIDNTLRWHTQIDYVCRKLNNKIALLKNIIYYLTDDMKLMYYNAYILPIFEYATAE